MKYLIMLIYATALTFAGCSHTIPPTATKPSAAIPIGKSRSDGPADFCGVKQAEAPNSSLPVTVTADLWPLSRIIQSAFPSRLTEEDLPLGYDYTWRFVREGEPQVQIQDGIVKYRAPYRVARCTRLSARSSLSGDRRNRTAFVPRTGWRIARHTGRSPNDDRLET